MLPKNLINSDNQIDVSLLEDSVQTYKRPKRNKRGRVPLKAFIKYIGGGSGDISTSIGNVFVNAKSQLYKMTTHKEDRKDVLFNIKETLEKPLFIYKDDDSFKFFGAFRRGNGNIFYMTSICKIVNDELTLMTNYQIRDLAQIKKFLNEERGELIYNGLGVKNGINHQNSVSQKANETNTNCKIIHNNNLQCQANESKEEKVFIQETEEATIGMSM